MLQVRVVQRFHAAGKVGISALNVAEDCADLGDAFACFAVQEFEGDGSEYDGRQQEDRGDAPRHEWEGGPSGQDEPSDSHGVHGQQDQDCRSDLAT